MNYMWEQILRDAANLNHGSHANFQVNNNILQTNRKQLLRESVNGHLQNCDSPLPRAQLSLTLVLYVTRRREIGIVAILFWE